MFAVRCSMFGVIFSKIQRNANPHLGFRAFVLALVSSVLAQIVAEQQVTFTYTDSKAKAVFITGEFNHWSTTATPMKRDESGKWTAQVALRPGKRAYGTER